MEFLTDIEFTMPTDNDYNIMELIAQKFYDDDDHWPVEEYNAAERTITIESAWATQEDVVGFATELLETVISHLAGKASGDVRTAIEGLAYTMHAHTSAGGYTEQDFIIERNGDKLTMKESFFAHEEYDNDEERADAYEEWLDDPNYGPVIDLKNIPDDDDDINEIIIAYLKANGLPHDAAAIAKLSMEDVYAIMAGTFGKDE
ncbi:MAG: hypothetical protein IJC70_06260 [Firmicutes bacterium]|nr:hypothetical protein [Bacillota bacterium]